MSKPRAGFDIDGVMYEWSKTARYMLREILPDSPYPKDGPLGQESTSWDYIQEHVSKEHWKWLWSEGIRLGLFRHGHLFPGTIKAVRAVAELGYDIIVITHRPKNAVHDTLDWLAFQKLPLAGVHLLTNQEPKSSVVPQCDIYIDDKPQVCEDLLGNTKARLVAMPDRPWNQDFKIPFDDSGRFARVHSWNEFVEKVRKLK